MYFVNDHYRLYELKNKLKTQTYLVASMIQQVGNMRPNKQLNIKDIVRIAYAKCLNINTLFDPWPLGINSGMDIDYIKRIDSTHYQWWRAWANTAKAKDGPNVEDTLKFAITGGNIYSSMDALISNQINKTIATSSQRDELKSDLVLNNDGDELIMISCYFRPQNFDKSKLGLFIMSPSFSSYDFGYHLIVVPKPGLFPVVQE